MRRTTKRALINLSLFGLALLFILSPSIRSTSKRVFAWTTVRYRASASQLPQALGQCPGLKGSEKPALIVSHVASDGNLDWLDSLKDLYYVCVYDIDGSIDKYATSLRVPANKGHEAMAYLTFLIDNYADLPPPGAVFVHGSRFAWHNDSPDYDNLDLLVSLNTSSALAPAGYHNLKCDWSASTCPPNTPPQGSLETKMDAKLQPWSARAVSDAGLLPALTQIFGGETLGRHDALRAQCCAQFVVSRENIWQHSREEYIALRQWLLEDGSESAPRDDRISGRILSYTWHILFLPQSSQSPRASPGTHGTLDLDRLNELACPSAEECYCRLYGRCELQACESPASCRGQYVLPKDYELPDDWAETHSRVTSEMGSKQGHDGLKR